MTKHERSYKKSGLQKKQSAAARAISSIARQAAASSRRSAGQQSARSMGMTSYAGYMGHANQLKAVDTQPGNTDWPFLTAGTIAQICTAMPKEGSAFYQRVGRVTKGKSLHLRGTIYPSLGNAAAVTQQTGRIVIVYDRQANGALPAIGDVLQTYTGSTNLTSPLSQINMTNRDRFTILRDRIFVLPPLGINGATPGKIDGYAMSTNRDGALVYEEFINLKGLETTYKASSDGSIGDVSTGSYLIIVFSDADANATAAWTVQMHVRYKYFD